MPSKPTDVMVGYGDGNTRTTIFNQHPYSIQILHSPYGPDDFYIFAQNWKTPTEAVLALRATYSRPSIKEYPVAANHI